MYCMFGQPCPLLPSYEGILPPASAHMIELQYISVEAEVPPEQTCSVTKTIISQHNNGKYKGTPFMEYTLILFT